MLVLKGDNLEEGKLASKTSTANLRVQENFPIQVEK